MKSWNKLMMIIGMSLLIITGSHASTTAKSLDQVFQEVSIIPVTGQISWRDGVIYEADSSQKLYKKDNKVFIPIRTAFEREYNILTDANKPNEVVINKHYTDESIKLQVGSAKATIGSKSVDLPDAIQKIEGTMVVSLEAYSQITGEKAYFKDEMVIFSEIAIDWNHPKSKEVLKKAKARLEEKRKPINHWSKEILTKYNDNIYYTAVDEAKDDYSEKLYIKRGNKAAEEVKLPGDVIIIYPEIVGEKIYFNSTVLAKGQGSITNEQEAPKSQTKMYTYDLTNGKILEVCDLTRDIYYNEREDSIEGIRWHKDKLYIQVHYFDWTMGGEDLVVLSGNKLQKVASAKAFETWQMIDNNLYYVDSMTAHGERVDNLFKVDLVTGACTTLGEKGMTYYTYMSSSDSYNNVFDKQEMMIKDNILYVVGSIGGDERAVRSVYAVDLASNTVKKLTVGVSAFEIIGDSIYYIDNTVGYLVRCDLDGGNKKTLISQPIGTYKYKDGNFYYTMINKAGSIQPGMYKYNIQSDTRVKVSSHLVEEIIMNQSGMYYKAFGYEEGIYKMTDKGNVCLVEGPIAKLKDTGKVLLYCSLYEEGVHTIK